MKWISLAGIIPLFSGIVCVMVCSGDKVLEMKEVHPARDYQRTQAPRQLPERDQVGAPVLESVENRIPPWKVMEQAFLSVYRNDEHSRESMEFLLHHLKKIKPLGTRSDPVVDHVRTLLFLAIGKIQEGKMTLDQFLGSGMKQVLLAYQKAAPHEVQSLKESLPKNSIYTKLMELSKD